MSHHHATARPDDEVEVRETCGFPAGSFQCHIAHHNAPGGSDDNVTR